MQSQKMVMGPKGGQLPPTATKLACFIGDQLGTKAINTAATASHFGAPRREKEPPDHHRGRKICARNRGHLGRVKPQERKIGEQISWKETGGGGGPATPDGLAGIPPH